MKPALRAVQLLWVNLIMDTFAALALATDPPTEKILDRPPQGKGPLITTTMWKQITGQNIYKITVIFVLYFAGGDILGYDLSDPNKQLELDTVIFNSFVWMQIFNTFNNRCLVGLARILIALPRRSNLQPTASATAARLHPPSWPFSGNNIHVVSCLDSLLNCWEC